MQKFALLTKDRKYRYFLSRIWNARLPYCIWVMINPSTADHIADDQTIFKITKISNFNNYGGFYIVNLFDLITPLQTSLEGKPMDELVLPISAEIHDSLFGNIQPHLKDQTVICAWGDGVPSIQGIMQQRIKYFSDIFDDRDISPLAVCINRSGRPSHPLYKADNLKLFNFKI